MKTLAILNDAIQLVDKYDYVTISLIVPFGNIQKMKESIKCKIVSVEKKKLGFNHHAGNVARVKIKVVFGNIQPFLKTSQLTSKTGNYSQYCDLLGRTGGNMCYSDQNLISDNVELYAFGTPILTRKNGHTNGIYVNRVGKKISLQKFDKYVNFKGEYFRLIDIK